jgi:hypothetical protein
MGHVSFWPVLMTVEWEKTDTIQKNTEEVWSGSESRED